MKGNSYANVAIFKHNDEDVCFIEAAANVVARHNQLRQQEIRCDRRSSSAGTRIAIARRMPETVHHPVQALLSDLYEKHRSNTGGHVATYIPELSKVNPD